MIEVKLQYLCPSHVNNDITFHCQVDKLEKGNIIGLSYGKFPYAYLYTCHARVCTVSCHCSCIHNFPMYSYNCNPGTGKPTFPCIHRYLYRIKIKESSQVLIKQEIATHIKNLDIHHVTFTMIDSVALETWRTLATICMVILKFINKIYCFSPH